MVPGSEQFYRHHGTWRLAAAAREAGICALVGEAQIVVLTFAKNAAAATSAAWRRPSTLSEFSFSMLLYHHQVPKTTKTCQNWWE